MFEKKLKLCYFHPKTQVKKLDVEKSIGVSSGARFTILYYFESCNMNQRVTQLLYLQHFLNSFITHHTLFFLCIYDIFFVNIV